MRKRSRKGSRYENTRKPIAFQQTGVTLRASSTVSGLLGLILSGNPEKILGQLQGSATSEGYRQAAGILRWFLTKGKHT
jgi:hypothetical protein